MAEGNWGYGERKFEVLFRRSEFGRSYVIIGCPFCARSVKAYIWSLAGHGKRCERCGALFTYVGHTAIREPKKRKKA